MAEQSFPFENIDTTESQFSEWATNFQETGVQGSPTGTELGITVTGSDLNLTVASGQAFIRGHYYINTSDLVIAVPTAGVNTRIDIVVVELDPEANTIVTKIVLGEAVSADPVAPTLTQSATGIYQLPIATLTIPTSTVVITTGMLVDTRTFMGNRIGIWTTATRPANPTAYQTLGYNTTIEAHESWNGTAWVGFFDPISTEGDLVVGDGTGQASRLGVGANDQVLTVVSGVPAWADGPSGGFSTVETLTSSGTFTVPDGISTLAVYVAGGGGGGGGGASRCDTNSAINTGGGGGGNGANLSYENYYAVTAGDTISYTIGAGGAGAGEIEHSDGANHDGSNGSDGSNSSFGAILSGGGAGGTKGIIKYNPDDFISVQTRPVNQVSGAFVSRAGVQAQISSNETSPADITEFIISGIYAGATGAVGGDNTISRGDSESNGGSAGNAGVCGAGGSGSGNSGPNDFSGNAGGGNSGGGGGGGGGWTDNYYGSDPTGPGGNGGANTGGGGGGSGASVISRSDTRTATIGAGGNGGAGFILVIY